MEWRGCRRKRRELAVWGLELRMIEVQGVFIYLLFVGFVIDIYSLVRMVDPFL